MPPKNKIKRTHKQASKQAHGQTATLQSMTQQRHKQLQALFFLFFFRQQQQ
jgi:hypothetical protein